MDCEKCEKNNPICLSCFKTKGKWWNLRAKYQQLCNGV